jgi:amidase
LRRSADTYASMFARHELLLSPTLAHTTPRIGELSPTVEFDELLHRLQSYVAFTPLQNAAGSPAISVPAGLNAEGLPLAVHFSAAHGDERTLLEIAYSVEAALPFASLTSSSASRSSLS